MNKNKIMAASASVALFFGAFSGVMTPANALAVHAPTDGWGIRSQICEWVPFWC